MKWLTLAYIKAHSRIDSTIEDNLLTLYGEAAEEVVLNICGRTYENIINVYGSVPKSLYQAALMLVDLSYYQRSPVSITSISTIPYTFDMLVKPYMRLTTGDDDDLPATQSVMLDVPYEEESGKITLDWSAYSFDQIKGLLDEGKDVAVRCMREGKTDNTIYLYPEGVEVGLNLTFSGALFGIFRVVVLLQRNNNVDPGVGDISSTVSVIQFNVAGE